MKTLLNDAFKVVFVFFFFVCVCVCVCVRAHVCVWVWNHIEEGKKLAIKVGKLGLHLQKVGRIGY